MRVRAGSYKQSSCAAVRLVVVVIGAIVELHYSKEISLSTWVFIICLQLQRARDHIFSIARYLIGESMRTAYRSIEESSVTIEFVSAGRGIFSSERWVPGSRLISETADREAGRAVIPVVPFRYESRIDS
jgi:hypothetical protein